MSGSLQCAIQFKVSLSDGLCVNCCVQGSTEETTSTSSIRWPSAAAMQGLSWSLCALLCLCLWGRCSCRGRRAKRASEDHAKCSYTFMVPEQKITGQITMVHRFFDIP